MESILEEQRPSGHQALGHRAAAEATDELADEELEQVSGGFWALLSGWRWLPSTVVNGDDEGHTNERGN